jgi:hypothetical protein
MIPGSAELWLTKHLKDCGTPNKHECKLFFVCDSPQKKSQPYVNEESERDRKEATIVPTALSALSLSPSLLNDEKT